MYLSSKQSDCKYVIIILKKIYIKVKVSEFKKDFMALNTVIESLGVYTPEGRLSTKELVDGLK